MAQQYSAHVTHRVWRGILRWVWKKLRGALFERSLEQFPPERYDSRNPKGNAHPGKSVARDQVNKSKAIDRCSIYQMIAT